MGKWFFGAAVLGLVFLGAGTGRAQEKALRGEIKIDGSSTVYLITEAMVSEFKKLHPDVKCTVGISGTGGGFKKFIAGETDINDASRAIKDKEASDCKARGIAYVELQVAWDGLAVIVHKDNTWAAKMTVEQLKKIWHPDTKDFKNAKKWSDVEPSWPGEEIQLYGAGPDSGTFDYFTEAINGKEKVCRTDYTASEDDNTTINGVERNKNAIGFLGLAYYEAHKDKLRVVHVKAAGGKEFVEPTLQTVLSRKYTPLGRPLFIYVRTTSLKRPEIKEFTEFYLRRGDLVGAAKYVPLSALQQRLQQKKLETVLGTLN
jgi:phosphate transport system substrate-binding protein